MKLGSFAGGLASGAATGIRLSQGQQQLELDKSRESRMSERDDIENEMRRNALDEKVQMQEAQDAMRQAGMEAYQPKPTKVMAPNPDEETYGPGMVEVEQPDPRPEGKRVLDGLDASWQKAIELGRPDAAQEAFQHAHVLRNQLRGQALDQADRRYEVNGDLSGYVDAYNNYVMDGGKINNIIQKEDGGLSIAGEMGGKEFTRDIKPDEKDKFLKTMRDPAAQWAQENKFAELKLKSSLKKDEIQAQQSAMTEREGIKQGSITERWNNRDSNRLTQTEMQEAGKGTRLNAMQDRLDSRTAFVEDNKNERAGTVEEGKNTRATTAEKGRNGRNSARIAARGLPAAKGRSGGGRGSKAPPSDQELRVKALSMAKGQLKDGSTKDIDARATQLFNYLKNGSQPAAAGGAAAGSKPRSVDELLQLYGPK
jgi:hypothetical protein